MYQQCIITYPIKKIYTQLMLITILFFLLISNAVTLKQEKSTLFSRTAIIGLWFTIVISLSNLYIKSLDKTIGIYGGLLNINTFSQSFNIFVFFISAIILMLTAFFARKITLGDKLSSALQGVQSYNKEVILNRKTKQYNITEYALIILFIICGAVFLISAGDLISIFLAIELQSYGLYILSTVYRDSELATGSGLTYFLLGGLSSCFILLGSAILYANSGSTNLDSIYIITDINNTDDMGIFYLWYKPNYLYLSFIIISVGFLFKISAAPFHFWSPDVYDGIPTIVTTYVAIVTKISILAFLLELVCHTNYTVFEFYLKNVLLISSVLSLIIGSVLGLTQFRIKRLLAYSTISHIGFILLALLINSAGSIQSYIFYILQYSLSNLNAFVIIITIGFSLYFYTHSVSSKNTEESHKGKLVDFDNSPLQLISQLKGYFYVNPFIAISLSITLLSFIGIPPVIGFFAKQMVLSAALDAGYVFITLIGIITSVIGAVYYLNIITQMFFYKEEYNKIGYNYNTDPKSSLSSKGLGDLEIEKKGEQHKNLFKKHYNTSVTMTAYEAPSSHKTDKQETINKFAYGIDNVSVASSLSGVISVITLLLVLFIFTPMEWFNVANILTLTLLV